MTKTKNSAKIRLVKGQEVVVIAGKDKGKKGEIVKVFPEENRVLVSGVNIVKKALKITETNDKNFLEAERPVHVSNVSAVDENGKRSKVLVKKGEDGRNAKFFKTSGSKVVVKKQS